MSELADQMRDLWAALETAPKPDTIYCGPVVYAGFDTMLHMPPGTDRRKVKRLMRRAMQAARKIELRTIPK
jgi:hypothetical protein